MSNQVEISRSDEGEIELAGNTVTGYAARFGTTSNDLGGFVERIDPKSFNKTVKESDVWALFNHSPDHPMAHTGNDTLRLTIDRSGLLYEFEIPGTPAGAALRSTIDEGLVGGSSFAGRLIRDKWVSRANPPMHQVLEVALRDVGPVVFPGYPDTEPSLKTLDPVLRSLAIARSLDLAEMVHAVKAGQLGAILGGEEIETAGPADTDPPISRHRYKHLIY